MKKMLNFTTLIAFLSLLAVSACSQVTSTDQIIYEKETSAPSPTVISKISSQIAASSIQELAYYSDVIIIGQVVSKEQIINTARNPGDPTQPDPQFFSINQVYKVEVESVLKGKSSKTLLVVQNQGRLITTSDIRPTSAEIESEINRNAQNTFVPLSLDIRYVFFLRVLDKISYDLGGYKSTDLFAGVVEPWRFRITSDRFVIPETLLPDANLCFPSKNLDDVEAIIEVNSSTYTPGYNNPCNSPYPSPLTNPPNSSELTPYP